MVKKQHDDAKSRIEEMKTKKKEQVEKEKTLALMKEARKIKKKEGKTKKLEMLESSILDRLKDTHQKQQEAIEEIEKIFKAAAEPGGVKKAFEMFQDSSVQLAKPADSLVAENEGNFDGSAVAQLP
jgi:hypothetical protein